VQPEAESWGSDAPELVAAEIHQGQWFSTASSRRTSELTHGVSVCYCLVAGVHTSIL
jgi:hypothetical protein